MYLIITKKKWHFDNFNKLKGKNFKLITNKKKLTYSNISKIKPKLIFFPHWSNKVSSKIILNFKCICFHETSLPYGRGGSPIQNLIIRGKKKTSISAFIMNNKLDSGDLISIKKKTLSLNGSAQQIYERSSKIIFEMIKEIINMKKIISFKQKGKVINFKRLKNNSEINTKINKLDKIYDHIRMLDAKTYKNAFIKKENLKITLSNVKKMKHKLTLTGIINLNDK